MNQTDQLAQLAQYERLIFGMSWRTAISDSREELIGYSKALDANCYVEAAFDVKHKYGFCKLKKVDKAQSAAVILGQILEGGSGIFIHQISRGEHCFIAVRDSLPVEECDIVGTREQVISAAKSYAEAIKKKDGVTPKYYGDADEISGCTTLNIPKLIDEGEGIGAICRVRSFNIKAALIAASLILVAGAWFTQDLIKLLSPAAPVVIDPKAEHHKAVVLAIDNLVALKKFPSNVMPGYIKFITALPAEIPAAGKPVDEAGWKLETVTCVHTDCAANWKRVGVATNKDFLDALAIEPGDLTVSFPSIDFISRKVTFSKNETLGKLVLGTQLKFGETVMSWLQTLKDRPRTDPLAPVVPATGDFKPEQADMPLSGGLSFTVPFSELQRVAALPNVLTIEKITLTYRDRQNIKFEFQGKYYAL